MADLSNALSNALTPDPVELQRRYDEDTIIKNLIERIEYLTQQAQARKTTAAQESEPIREKNRGLSKQRASLLQEIRRNDAKIRSIWEAARLGPQALAITKRKLKGRKDVVRDRLIKQMLCGAREQMHKELKASLKNPPPEPPPEPPTTESTTL